MTRVLHFAGIINRHDFIDAVLTRLDRSRFDVFALTGVPPRRAEPYRDGEAYDGRCLNMPATRRNYPGMIRELMAEIRRFQPHVVHAHHFDESFVAALVSKVLRRPALVIGHHYSDHIYFLSTGWRRRVHLAIEAFSNRAASRVVVPAKEVYDLLVDRQHVPPAKVRVIPYGLEFDRYQASSPEAPARLRAEYGLDGKYVVLTCCRLNREKGLEYFLKAVAALRDQGRHFAVVLVGDGPERQALQALSHALGLDGLVTFAGWRNDALDWMAAADVVVQPSLCESYCQVLVEALAFGKPVIMTPVGAGPEIIGANERGRLVAKADVGALAAALDELMNAPQLGEELGRRGLEFVRRHSRIDAIVRQHEQVYDQAIGLNPASRLETLEARQ